MNPFVVLVRLDDDSLTQDVRNLTRSNEPRSGARSFRTISRELFDPSFIQSSGDSDSNWEPTCSDEGGNSAFTPVRKKHLVKRRWFRKVEGDKPYACEECDYRAARCDTLKTHMKIHTGEKHSCNVCKYRAPDANTLRIHLTNHSDNRPYACAECGYRAAAVTDLGRHMRTHTGERPHACDECEYKAARAITLKRHMKTHTGERPYACDKCEYTSPRASNLQVHMKTHSSERKYACNYCGYRGASPAALKRHIKHTCKKPYDCDELGNKVALAHKFRRPMKTHTGRQPNLTKVPVEDEQKAESCEPCLSDPVIPPLRSVEEMLSEKSFHDVQVKTEQEELSIDTFGLDETVKEEHFDDICCNSHPKTEPEEPLADLFLTGHVKTELGEPQ